ALDREGKVYAWGTGDFGQLGNGATENSSTPVTVDMTGVLSGKTVVSVSVGMNHSLALCSDGTVVAWGGNEYGQLGNGSTEYTTRPVAVDMSGVLAGKTVVSVSAGQYHSVALCSDGTLAAWGWNNSGELGNGATSYFPTTRPVAVDMTGVLAGRQWWRCRRGSITRWRCAAMVRWRPGGLITLANWAMIRRILRPRLCR
ncbi:MAG TPA: hypothetical protein PK879_07820, partial [Opitutaceae bacterium]|nr:hypothetical protein [Opitutaceae bacterium]